MIKNKTPNEIREYFGIKTEFTPEEYEFILNENEWVDKSDEED
jgi:hypothetical protein